MKRGIRTGRLDVSGYGRWGDNLYLKLKNHGYDCSDFNMSRTDLAPYSFDEEERKNFLAEEKKLAQAAGIEISQVHGPWRFPPQDASEDDRRKRMEEMRASISMCAELGSKYWVVHPIMPFGIKDIRDGKEAETWAMNLEFMRELLTTAKQYDVTICLENMPFPEFSLSPPSKIGELVKTIDDAHFQMCLDTGHFIALAELSLCEEIARVAEMVRVLHVHDSFPGEDAHLLPMQGIIDWQPFVKELRKIGFGGVFSLETMPSGQLSDDAFEQACQALADTLDLILAE